MPKIVKSWKVIESVREKHWNRTQSNRMQSPNKKAIWLVCYLFVFVACTLLPFIYSNLNRAKIDNNAYRNRARMQKQNKNRKKMKKEENNMADKQHKAKRERRMKNIEKFVHEIATGWTHYEPSQPIDAFVHCICHPIVPFKSLWIWKKRRKYRFKLERETHSMHTINLR